MKMFTYVNIRLNYLTYIFSLLLCARIFQVWGGL
nr:MAG TPA: hypothetical protein [Caudoviricetes sp.]DAO90161.1 MAG TPA: hypothetical protein [Bacteriophage sp.]DAR18318.1 MAG TPA: hypothetical protein [Caudoviricetes sp.]DAU02224.1 MAG TPA: hypothetical protein [Caudoviricetes sp.]